METISNAYAGVHMACCIIQPSMPAIRVISMALMSMPDPRINHPQARADTPRIPASNSSRSRRTISSRNVDGPMPGTPHRIKRGSAAPVEAMKRSGVSIPTAHVRVGPATAFRVGDLHAIDLKGGMRHGARDACRMSGTILERFQLCIGDGSDGKRRRFTPLDIDIGHLRRPPTGYHAAENRLEHAAFLTAENRLQLSLLLLSGSRVQIEPSRAVAVEEVAWPVRSQGDACAAQVHAVRLTLLDFKAECSRAPTLVRLPLWT